MYLKNSPQNMYVMQGSLKTQEEKEKKIALYPNHGTLNKKLKWLKN